MPDESFPAIPYRYDPLGSGPRFPPVVSAVITPAAVPGTCTIPPDATAGEIAASFPFRIGAVGAAAA